MSAREDRALQILIETHEGADQLGPGSEATTERAFSLLPQDLSLGAGARILDLGCGTGRQTLTLARLAPDATIDAYDLIPSYVATARERFAAAGLGDRVRAHTGSMTDVAALGVGVSLIWSEGAIYNVGVEAGLSAWRPVLAPGGCVAFSEACWLVDDPPDAPRAFWEEGYPQMRGVDENLERIARAGFRALGHFTLPESDWWTYYEGLAPGLARMRERYASDPAALAEIDASRFEEALYREHADAYGYVFYVARRVD